MEMVVGTIMARMFSFLARIASAIFLRRDSRHIWKNVLVYQGEMLHAKLRMLFDGASFVVILGGTFLF